MAPRLIQQFDKLSASEIEDLPGFEELEIVGPEARTLTGHPQVIRLGELCEQIQAVLSENRLFARRGDSPSLLDASAEMLDPELIAGAAFSRSLRGPFPIRMNFVARLWKDPIF
jgi:hypothetical protein